MARYDSEHVDRLRQAYRQRKGIIEDRIGVFQRLMEGSEEDVFAELCFCICTPQSKAKTCDRAIRGLVDSRILFSGSEVEIRSKLREVRFCENKARYIVAAREQFTRDGRIQIKSRLSGHLDHQGLREWLVNNVKGLGYKEASHFLRNIGLGLDMAILDRHILKNLKLAGVIEEIPATFSRKRYLEVEGKMRAFSEEIDIPLGHLDLLLWSQETGEVFK